MPEGPEIRLAGDRIAKVLQRCKATAIHFAFPSLKEYEEELTGQKITSVETRGKAMLIHFSEGLSIYSHNQLYGRWVTTRGTEPPTTNRQIRLSISTSKGTAWLLSASEIEVLDENGREEHSYLSKLGPNPLEDSCTEKELIEFWSQPRFARRSLAAMLLDQGFLAGVGNYLRSEILFVAALDPTGKRPSDLTVLAHAALTMCRQAYRLKGITNDEELAKKLRAKGWKRRDYRHWVFNREGQACHRCGKTIKKVVLAGRRLYYCPGCQLT